MPDSIYPPDPEVQRLIEAITWVATSSYDDRDGMRRIRDLLLKYQEGGEKS